MNPLEDFLTEKVALEKQSGTLSNLAGGFLHGLTFGGRAAPTDAGAAANVGKFVGSTVASGAIMAALTGGAHAAEKGVTGLVGAVKNRFKKPAEYAAMLDAHPTLKSYDAGKVQMVFNSLRHLSPQLASDPLVAGSFVRNVMIQSPYEGLSISPDMARMLVDAESKISKDRDKRPGPAIAALYGYPGGKGVLEAPAFDYTGTQETKREYSRRERKPGEGWVDTGEREETEKVTQTPYRRGR